MVSAHPCPKEQFAIRLQACLVQQLDGVSELQGLEPEWWSVGRCCCLLTCLPISAVISSCEAMSLAISSTDSAFAVHDKTGNSQQLATRTRSTANQLHRYIVRHVYSITLRCLQCYTTCLQFIMHLGCAHSLAAPHPWTWATRPSCWSRRRPWGCCRLLPRRPCRPPPPPPRLAASGPSPLLRRRPPRSAP